MVKSKKKCYNAEKVGLFRFVAPSGEHEFDKVIKLKPSYSLL